MKDHFTPQNGSGGSSRTETFFVLIVIVATNDDFYTELSLERVYRVPDSAVVFPKFYC